MGGDCFAPTSHPKELKGGAKEQGIGGGFVQKGPSTSAVEATRGGGTVRVLGRKTWAISTVIGGRTSTSNATMSAASTVYPCRFLYRMYKRVG